MSLVGIQTAIEIMTVKIVGSFGKMGAEMMTITSGGTGSRISRREAELFKNNCTFASAVSVSRVVSPIEQVKYMNSVTDPTVSLVEADENYLTCVNGLLSEGRMFSASDVASSGAVAVIGDNVRQKLFGSVSGAAGRTILAGGRHYLVAGVMERQGAMLGTGLDDSVIVPISGEGDFSITVLPSPDIGFKEAVRLAEVLMRSVRRLPLNAERDFDIVKADSLQDNLLSLKGKLSAAALIIGLITLLGSTVGLMNIMLVSVKERRREIGIRKALGAKPSVIGIQFLAEAVAIGQAGGIAGIMLGIACGNIVALLMEGQPAILWDWVALSVVICLVVSILSGFVPARRAASLDPIAALHAE